MRRSVITGHEPTTAAVGICLLLVAASAAPVAAGDVPAVDRIVRAWITAHQNPQVFAVLDALTRLAHWPRVCALLVLVATALATARRTVRPLVHSLLSVSLCVLLTGSLKAVMGRPGPTGVTPPAYDGAWPSGHATALVVATVVMLQFGAALRARWVAAAFVPAVALSAALVYCGHHWLTDVAVAFPVGILLAWTSRSLQQWGRSLSAGAVRHDGAR